MINNRYRIVESLKQSRQFSTYIVSDTWDKHKKMQFNILNPEFVPDSLINYYSNEFLNLINLSSQNIIRNYNFNIISRIDNKLTVEHQYYFTCEYFEKTKDLLEYIESMDLFQIMEVFLDLCRAVYYLHLKGYIYGSLSLSSICVAESNGTYIPKLKDVATVELEKRLFTSDNSDDSYYKSPKQLAGESPSIASDMYSLGVILLTLLAKEKDHSLSPMDKLAKVAEEFKSNSFDSIEIDFINKLIPLIRKLITFSEEYASEGLSAFITELNTITDKDYKIVRKEEIEKLNLHSKIIGRENEINQIITAYDYLINYKPGKKVFLVKGDTGIGKTRFLQELRFLLELKGANVYSSYSLNTSDTNSNKLWTDILRKLILESDTDTLEKYELELKKFFPDSTYWKKAANQELSDTDVGKYRLISRIASFINDSIRTNPIVIIVDNIQLADEFTIDIFTYLYTEIIKNKNLILIFSYNDGEGFNNPRVLEFIDNFKMKRDFDTIHLSNLNNQQSGELIKVMLSMPHVPMKLADRFYTQSYGNPLFISELIKDFFNRKIIIVNSNTGKWQIDLPETDGYKLLAVPDSIEQAVFNQLKDSDIISYEIIKVISVFSSAVSIEDLSVFLNIPSADLERLVQELVNKGILCIKIADTDYVYEINNKVLKDIVYEKIGSKERIIKHKTAAEMLEKKKDISSMFNMDEFIYHLEKSNAKEKAKMYCIENAKRMKSFKDTKSQVQNLEKAISFIKRGNQTEKAELLIEIAMSCNEIGDFQSAMNYLKKAEKLAQAIKNDKYLLAVYLNMAQSFSRQHETKKTRKYLKKVEIELKKSSQLEAYLEYKQIKAMVLLDENSLEKCEQLCLEVINECGESLNKVKGLTLIVLASVYAYKNRAEEALELNNKSISLLEAIGCTSGVLSALNNIGCIYGNNYRDLEKALEYFTKARNLSEQYGCFPNELLGLMNIASIYYDKYDYQSAYDYFKYALKKAIKLNYSSEIFYLNNVLTRVCIDLGYYSEVFVYHSLCKKKLGYFSDRSPDTIEFYKSSSHLYRTFGDFDRAEKYIAQTISFYRNGSHMDKFNSIIESHILKLNLKESGSHDSVVNKIIAVSQNLILNESKIFALCNAAIVVGQKKDYKNAKKLLAEAEKLGISSIHDEVKAQYHYAKGIAETGKDSEIMLMAGLKLGKKVNNIVLISKISICLGDYYFHEKNYYYSASYYIEACELIRNLIYQVPDEFKLTYVNNCKLLKPFYRVKQIKSALILKEENCMYSNNDKYKIESSEELSELISIDESVNFMKNKKFMNLIGKQYMSILSNDIYNDKDILTNLSNNTLRNIELLIKYLAAMTLATRGLLVLEGQRHELSVISSTNDNCKLPSNKSIFNRIRTNLAPICVSKRLIKSEIDNSLLSEGLTACLCIPITNIYSKDATQTSGSNIIGYLYLESDKVLNNFNNEGLQGCLKYANLLMLLIEKHQLKFAASIDKLTGSLTRKYLEDTLNEVLEKSNTYKEIFSILMYDLDRFKTINDRFGHQTGDDVLSTVSKTIMTNIDTNDYLGRYGGEEFIVILPSANTEKALSIAEELRKKVELEKILGDRADITISIGVVSYPEHGKTIKELIERADQALYVAKENGRNKCQVWDRKFTNKVKMTNKLSGIISGNEVKDSRNILALVELIQLMNKNLPKKEKIHSFLGRMIEITEAQFGNLLLIDNGVVIESYGRKSQVETWIEDISFNENIVKSVFESKQSLYMIDWDKIEKYDSITGLPDWNSIIAVPVIIQDEIKGIIYLSTSTRIKEYGVNELNFINIISDLIAKII